MFSFQITSLLRSPTSNLAKKSCNIWEYFQGQSRTRRAADFIAVLQQLLFLSSLGHIKGKWNNLVVCSWPENICFIKQIKKSSWQNNQLIYQCFTFQSIAFFLIQVRVLEISNLISNYLPHGIRELKTSWINRCFLPSLIWKKTVAHIAGTQKAFTFIPHHLNAGSMKHATDSYTLSVNYWEMNILSKI